MQSEFGDVIDVVRQKLKRASTIYLVCLYTKRTKREFPCYKDADLALFAEAADAELYAANLRKDGFIYKVKEAKVL